MSIYSPRATPVRLLLVLLLLLLVACNAADEATPTPAPSTPDTLGFAAPSPGNDGPAVRQGAPARWLVMLYQNADDPVLEQDIFIDLNEAELVGSTDEVHIVSLLDRSQGGFAGDGDWTTARRYYITRDDDVERVTSPYEELGEVNMADGQTLVDFVTWAVEHYPAERYALILADHGRGWPGGWTDSDSAAPGPTGLALGENGDELFLMELDEALETIRATTGIEKLDLIGFDACLMAHIEVFSAMAPHARYAVASQEVEPAIGWAYAGFLQRLVEEPAMDGRALSAHIVATYIDEDARIVNPAMRGAFEIGRGAFEIGRGAFEIGRDGLEAVTTSISRDITLSAVDLSQMAGLTVALDDFALAINALDQGDVAEARRYAQSFRAVFGDKNSPSYIDLGNFAQLLLELDEPDVTASGERLLTQLEQSVVAEKHGPDKPGAMGISIYFPTSTRFYENPATNWDSYATVSRRFTEQSLWDEFLFAHYTDQYLAADGALDGEAELFLPWLDPVEIMPIELSSDTVASDGAVTLRTQVYGSHIAHIYFFAGYAPDDGTDIVITEMDFMAASRSYEVNGVHVPDWDAEAEETSDGWMIEIEFEWQPTLYSIKGGSEEPVLALFYPAIYGRGNRDTYYTVDGIYTFTDSGEPRYAVLYFDANGRLRFVLAFTNLDGTGAPRELTPRKGDTFTILDWWITTNRRGELMDEYVAEGETLTFGDSLLEWEAEYTFSGYYYVGFMVEDLEGNFYEQYEIIEVVE